MINNRAVKTRRLQWYTVKCKSECISSQTDTHSKCEDIIVRISKYFHRELTESNMQQSHTRALCPYSTRLDEKALSEFIESSSRIVSASIFQTRALQIINQCPSSGNPFWNRVKRRCTRKYHINLPAVIRD